MSVSQRLLLPTHPSPVPPHCGQTPITFLDFFITMLWLGIPRQWDIKQGLYPNLSHSHKYSWQETQPQGLSWCSLSDLRWQLDPCNSFFHVLQMNGAPSKFNKPSLWALCLAWGWPYPSLGGWRQESDKENGLRTKTVFSVIPILQHCQCHHGIKTENKIRILFSQGEGKSID